MNELGVSAQIGGGAAGAWSLASQLTPAVDDSSPIRVAFVVHSMHVAGVEILVAETIRRLGARLIPTVFCLDAVGPLGEQLRDDGVDVVCLGRRPGRDLRLAWRLAMSLRARRIAVVHAHQYTPFFYAALARVLCGRAVQLIFTEHGRHYPDLVSPLRRTLNRFFFSHAADAINAVCAFSAQSLAHTDGFCARRIDVIDNGIDAERYRTPTDRALVRARLGLAPDRRYVVNVARLHPVKDQATLLHAFQLVAGWRSDVDLLFVGDGPLRGALESLAHQLGIESRVHFLGRRADIPAILGAVDLFVLTSLSEAAPLTLLESMASGLPVVATAVGGNPEIVRDGIDGLLVPRIDVAATAAAIRRLLDDPQLARAMGAAGAARARDRYRIEGTMAAYLQLYTRLGQRPGAQR